MDQRIRVLDFDVENGDNQEKTGAKLSFQLRFAYSRALFQQSLLQDLEALIDKEYEYLQYLENCLHAINEVIVRGQSIVRGWLLRRRMIE
jgi:hypothetical protein